MIKREFDLSLDTIAETFVLQPPVDADTLVQVFYRLEMVGVEDFAPPASAKALNVSFQKGGVEIDAGSSILADTSQQGFLFTADASLGLTCVLSLSSSGTMPAFGKVKLRVWTQTLS